MDVSAIEACITVRTRAIMVVHIFGLQVDMDPLMDPVDRAPALVDVSSELFPVKFGIDYTSAEF